MITDYLECDLSNTRGIPRVMENIFIKMYKSHTEEICRINNAGMLSPIKLLQDRGADEIRKNIAINLIVPLVMTVGFLKLMKAAKSVKKFVNVSSKAFYSPRSRWTCYNSSKAGINNITQRVAIEQDNADYPVKIIYFYPGPWGRP